MKYMGSKNRIAKYILPVILKGRTKDQWYVEPFCGGCNMIDKVDGNRLASDSNEFVIAAMKLIRDNPDILPKDNTQTNEELYNRIKKHGLCTAGKYGYYGFSLSYGGMWFSGWRRDKEGKRDYVAEAFRSAKKQSIKLKGVVFKNRSYDNLKIPANSIIYCDPPYMDTAKYKGVDKFNHDNFWEWCRSKSKEGHKIFISEYNAPADFKCIWYKQINSSLTKDTGSKRGVEKLFIHHDIQSQDSVFDIFK